MHWSEMPARVTVRIDGIQGLLRNLGDPPIHAKPWLSALEKGLRVAEAAIGHFVPGGRTEGIKAEVQKAAVPRWGKVMLPNRTADNKVKRTTTKRTGFLGLQTKTTTRKVAFRYLGALHGSKRIAFHYRSGPFQGSRTLDWFEKARAHVRDKTVPLLAAAAHEIESLWGKDGN